MADGMKPCKVCGKTVSPNVAMCPHCGEPVPKSLWSNPYLVNLSIITALIVMFLKPQELVDVLAYIWPLLVGTVVLAGIVYFVFVRQGGVADDDDQDK